MDKLNQSINMASASGSTHSFTREASNLRSGRVIAQTQFAGRLGGNQEFVVDPNSEDARSLQEKQPDSVRTGNGYM